jgi:hypothetical protein
LEIFEGLGRQTSSQGDLQCRFAVCPVTSSESPTARWCQARRDGLTAQQAAQAVAEAAYYAGLEEHARLAA